MKSVIILAGLITAIIIAQANPEKDIEEKFMELQWDNHKTDASKVDEASFKDSSLQSDPEKQSVKSWDDQLYIQQDEADKAFDESLPSDTENKFLQQKEIYQQKETDDASFKDASLQSDTDPEKQISYEDPWLQSKNDEINKQDEVDAEASFEPQATAQINAASLVSRYAGMGYNILQANPEGDFNRGGIDPGIKTTRFVFKQTYANEKSVYYQTRRMTVPDQVEFHHTSSCVMTNSYSAYSGQTSYKKELSLNIQASGSYSGLFSASFSLSSGMKRARETTQNRRSVIIQKTEICNLAQTRYNLANALQGVDGYDLTEDFKNAIRRLPLHYSVNTYTRFLDDWGTHILEEVSVGTRTIQRSRANYIEVYSALRTSQQHSGGVGFSGFGVGAEISLDINTLSQSITRDTNIGHQETTFKIGSKSVPLPIHMKIVPISIVTESVFWDSSERTQIRKKGTNLKRALTDYAQNKHAGIASDPDMTVEAQWPGDKFSLPQTTSGCPSGFASGSVYQDNEDRNNANSYTPSNTGSYLKVVGSRNFRIYYCTKTYSSNSYFDWPQGQYCIARYGGSCPRDFSSGYRHWDDEDNDNRNSISRPVPDGTYNRNTRIKYCCRSDGSPNNAIILPTKNAFILYRFGGNCQRVRGMRNPLQLKIHFDDEDNRNANKCDGSRPDGTCDRNHDIFFCYYGN